MADKKGFNLAEVLGSVSNLDTGSKPGREQIEYIDIDLIDADERNFYELSGIEDLAANIQLVGLQQPLRVRDGENGHVITVSGHRRLAAMQLLVDEGFEQFRTVPCIREQAAASDALQELRLIYANSDTRHMTSPELSRQAERVEALLYQLKEEGVEFPGRMRDHVAQACQVSKSKLARLKVIRENLIPELAALYQGGTINESVAYALAQMSQEMQADVLEYGGQPDRWIEGSVKMDESKIRRIRELSCKSGATCVHQETLLRRRLTEGQWQCGQCCADCYDLDRCKEVCPEMASVAAAKKAEKRERKKQERIENQKAEAPKIETIGALWRRFAAARQAAGKSVREVMEAVTMFPAYTIIEQHEALEQGKTKLTADTRLPFFGILLYDDVKRIVALADALDVSLDYLFCRTDDPEVHHGE